MKKQRIIGIALLAAAALLIAVTGVVYAHGRTPMGPVSEEDAPDGYYGPMMHGFRTPVDEDGEFPPMMSAMVEAVSEATGLSVDDIEAQILEGEHLYTIALDAGLSEDDYAALMDEVRQSYFEDYQDGWRNNDRYEWMQEHMQEEWEEHGFGPFSDPDGDRPFNGGGMWMPFGGCW
ncbi:hypothetical protein KQH62_00435 [bacterium]|nr:hypothetical protein [bacterium]